MKAAVASAAISAEEQMLLEELLNAGDPDDSIPTIARDARMMRRIETVVRNRQTSHELVHGDARAASELAESSVQLVVTSPPYWTLKRYNDHEQQMGHVDDYDQFMSGLDQVWRNCYRALVPGGRLVINV